MVSRVILLFLDEVFFGIVDRMYFVVWCFFIVCQVNSNLFLFELRMFLSMFKVMKGKNEFEMLKVSEVEIFVIFN